MDLPDIEIVIQWCATPSISTLWQRFGRCVRDPTLEGTAIIFAEKEYFDVLTNEKKKRKRNSSSIKIEPGTSSTVKQAKLGASMNRSAASRDHEASDEEGEDEDEDEDEDEKEEDVNEDVKDDEKGKGKKMKSSKYSRKKSKKEKIEPAVFTLLNADTRGVSCRRQPFSDQFENTKAGEFHICDSVRTGLSDIFKYPSILNVT
jgi:superfamily II DNA/RNA helicase